jgi:hypothetical protein
VRNTVRRRIAALERRSSGGLACPMCGHDPNAPIRYEIIWEAEEDEDEPLVSSPLCPRCLYRSLTVIDWEEVVTDPERERANREHRRSLEEQRAEYLEGRPDLTELQTLHDYSPESWNEGGGAYRY